MHPSLYETVKTCQSGCQIRRFYYYFIKFYKNLKKNSSCHSLTLHAIILLNLLNKSWKSAQKLYACPNTYAPYCIFVVFHIICIVSFTCMNFYVPISVWVPACNFFLCAIKQPSMSYHFWPSGACMIVTVLSFSSSLWCAYVCMAIMYPRAIAYVCSVVRLKWLT